MTDKIHAISTINRRRFLKRSGELLCAAAAGAWLPGCDLLCAASPKKYYLRPARYWEKAGDGSVRCLLCPNACVIGDGEQGACRARKNIGGALFTLVYSRIAAMQVDPVEKKPLYHFLPGSLAFSIATAGCNMSCKFCQNWQISQSDPDEIESFELPSQALASRARESGARIVAYTYNEPTVQFEYICDSSARARAAGLRPVIISNGYINVEPGKELAKNLDGVKIDLKAFSEDFYSRICGGGLKSVLKNLESIHATGRWLEIVVLVIPTLNDSAGEIKKMAAWVRKNLSPDVPMHFTRFHSMYLIRNLPPTPVSTLERCRSIAAAEGIRYPYVGNVPGHRWENTYCHGCGKPLIDRSGFIVIRNRIRNGKCPSCGAAIPGVWA